MKPPPRVLVIRGGAIGDFILTLPVMRLLREMIPNCHLEVMGYLNIATLAQAAGLADSVRSLDHRTMAALFAKTAPIDEALSEHLKSFNLIVSYLFDPDGHFRASMERVSGSEKKNWPLERWLALADEFRNHEVIFITGEAEQERGVLINNRPNWHSLPLPELASRLSTCAAFLGHDSGISHLAAACGVPSLLLFGPTDPAVWAPPQPWVTVLRAENGDLASLEDQQVKLAARQVVSKS